MGKADRRLWFVRRCSALLVPCPGLRHRAMAFSSLGIRHGLQIILFMVYLHGYMLLHHGVVLVYLRHCVVPVHRHNFLASSTAGRPRLQQPPSALLNQAEAAHVWCTSFQGSCSLLRPCKLLHLAVDCPLCPILPTLPSAAAAAAVTVLDQRLIQA